MAPIRAAKKYCEYCNCWMANNKISIQNHEQADRHKNSVQQRIRNMQKTSADEDKEQAAIAKSLLAVNDAAMVSMLKDIKRDPSLAKRYGITLSEEELSKLKEKDSTDPDSSILNAKALSAMVGVKKELNAGLPVLNVHQIKWREVKASDGKIYYWNKITNETSWERPNELIESLEDQPLNIKAEKDRMNQFLFNRLVQLSEDGVAGASEAVCSAFDANPAGSSTQPPDETVSPLEEEEEQEQEQDEEEPPVKHDSPKEEREEEKQPEERPTHRGKKDSFLLGEWQTVIEEPVAPLPKLDLPSQVAAASKKIQLKLNKHHPHLTKAEIEQVQQKAEKLGELAELTHHSLYGRERFEIGEKVLPTTGIARKRPHRNEDDEEESRRQQELQLNSVLFQMKKESQETKTAELKVKSEDQQASAGLFKKRNISKAARNSRTTSFAND